MFADTRSPQLHTAYFSLCGPCQLSFQVSFKVEVDFALFFFCFCVRVICFLFRYISKFFFCVCFWMEVICFFSELCLLPFLSVTLGLRFPICLFLIKTCLTNGYAGSPSLAQYWWLMWLYPADAEENTMLAIDDVAVFADDDIDIYDNITLCFL